MHGSLTLYLPLSTAGFVPVEIGGSSFGRLIKAASPEHADTVLDLVQRHKEKHLAIMAISSWKIMAAPINPSFGCHPTSARNLSSFVECEDLTLSDFQTCFSNANKMINEKAQLIELTPSLVKTLKVYQAVVRFTLHDHETNSAKNKVSPAIEDLSKEGMRIPLVAGCIHVFGAEYKKIITHIGDNIPSWLNNIPDTLANTAAEDFVEILLSWDGSANSELLRICNDLQNFDDLIR